MRGVQGGQEGCIGCLDTEWGRANSHLKGQPQSFNPLTSPGPQAGGCNSSVQQLGWVCVCVVGGGGGMWTGRGAGEGLELSAQSQTTKRGAEGPAPVCLAGVTCKTSLRPLPGGRQALQFRLKDSWPRSSEPKGGALRRPRLSGPQASCHPPCRSQLKHCPRPGRP